MQYSYRILEQENRRLRRAVEELSLLNDLATAIGGARDLDAIMRTIIQRALRAVEAEQGVITLVADDADAPMQTVVRTMAGTDTQPALRPDDLLLGWMHLHKTPLLLNDPHSDPRFRSAGWPASIRSLLSVPLMTHGRLTGLLTVFNKRDGPGFLPTDQRLLAIIAAQSAQVLHGARLAEERERVLQVFGQHTAPAVVDELLRQGTDLPSQRREVCVLFLDIRGFTAFSETREPEEVVAYLNRLFDVMIAQVNAHHGIIHQLLGDGFMALFGAPLSHSNDRQNAAEAALAIVDAVEHAVGAGRLPPTRLGIGLHAGEVVAGTVGSAIHKEYKVTGDVVNLAARIEQMTKTFDAQVLVSDAVWQALEPGRFEGRALGDVEVRGRAEPVRLYRLA